MNSFCGGGVCGAFYGRWVACAGATLSVKAFSFSHTQFIVVFEVDVAVRERTDLFGADFYFLNYFET